MNNHIRAVQPWPKPTTTLLMKNREPFKVQILKTKINRFPTDNHHETQQVEPGEIIEVTKTNLIVQTGQGENLIIKQIQPAGKKLMDIEEFLRGYQPQPGDRFGSFKESE
ncbi:MAG: hypothetical protein R3C11_07965 [Planctomycetaceae bacterium]